MNWDNSGYRMKSSTETIFFIPKHQVPEGQKATYANAVCDYIPLKDDPYRVRLAVGEDILIYSGDPSAPAAYLLCSKLIFKSTISIPVAQLFYGDIKYYLLNNPMSRFEYMESQLRWFPQYIIDQ